MLESGFVALNEHILFEDLVKAFRCGVKVGEEFYIVVEIVVEFVFELFDEEGHRGAAK